MTDLVKEYGYYSSGETFSIADKNEAWVMEMIGKGPGNKGAVGLSDPHPGRLYLGACQPVPYPADTV